MYESVGEIVRRCEHDRLPLRIRGGGVFAGDCESESEICETTTVNQLIDYAHGDMTITVQAGMTIATLQNLLAEHRQCLPLDVPRPEQITIGEVIATDWRGSRQLSCGGPRDVLIGIGVVTGGGKLIRGGGRVVKNVAGYDLCKLYTGSRGWLGVIVETSLKVSAIPEWAAAVAVAFETPDEAETACAGSLSGVLRPASIDLLNAIAAEFVDLPASPLTLVVGFEGFREDVEAQVGACLGESPRSSVELDAETYRRLKQRVADMAAERSGIFVRCRVISDRVAALVAEMTALGRDRGITAHVADGLVNILAAGDDMGVVCAASDRTAALGGSWLIPGRRPAASALPAMIGPPRGDWPLMRRIKQALDPADIFERGSAFDQALRMANG